MARKKKEDEENTELTPAAPVVTKSRMVKLQLPVPIVINDKTYMGQVSVDEDLARDLINIADRKRRADASVFTGKSYLVEKTLSNRLIITESEV